MIRKTQLFYLIKASTSNNDQVYFFLLTTEADALLGKEEGMEWSCSEKMSPPSLSPGSNPSSIGDQKGQREAAETYFLGHEHLPKEGCPWPNSSSGKFNFILVVSADVEVYGKGNFMEM